MPISSMPWRSLSWWLLIVLIWLGLLAILFGRDFLIREVDLRQDEIIARGRQAAQPYCRWGHAPWGRFYYHA